MTTALALTTYTPPDRDRGNLLFDPAAFRHAMDVAASLAVSQLVPQAFRGKPADVFFAMNLARRMDEDLFTVMQVVHFVHGKPGWYAPFLIARANASGRFSEPLRWTYEGAGETRSCTCSAKLADGAPVSSTVDMRMAREEGWAGQNKKYQTMRDQMLAYRSATFLIRLYAPGIMYGLPTSDEVEDIEPPVTATVIADSAAPTDAGKPEAPARGLAAVDAALGGPTNPPPPPAAEQKPAKPRPTPEQAAEILRDTLAGKDRLSVDDARRALRTALDVRQITEETWGKIDAHGRRQGWWRIEDNGRTFVLGPAPEPDRWAALDNRSALLDHIEAVSRKVGSQASAVALAEVSMTESDVETTEDLDELRKLGRALDRQDAALRAEAAQ